ncbi:MAG: hypothetical protein H0U23_09985 [Blastocatellia bacterium]|nr:hypothetical protein [Blastocatellia bacterium]
MKTIKKHMQILFAIAILCSVSFGDPGDMGGGGLAAPASSVKVSETTGSTEDGDMGGGGLAAGMTSDSYIDSVLLSIQGYFEAIF